MKWAIPKHGGIEIPSNPSHRDPAFASDFNSSLPEQDSAGICVLPIQQITTNQADLDIQEGRLHTFDSVREMLDSLDD